MIFTDNDLSCYASCLSDINDLQVDLSVFQCSEHPTSQPTSQPTVFVSFQDIALCGFIAATDISTMDGKSVWSCTSNGVTSSDPCDSGSVWSGLTCDGMDISEISLGAIGLQGTVI